MMQQTTRICTHYAATARTLSKLYKANARERTRMVRYSFSAPDDTWTEWKNTVPRSISLEQRLNELIDADARGAVLDDDTIAQLEPLQKEHEPINDTVRRLATDHAPENTTTDPPTIQEALSDWPPNTKDNPDDWHFDAQLVLGYVQSKDTAGKSDVIDHVADDRAIKSYNPENWWENIVVPALKHAEEQRLVEYDNGLKKWVWRG